MRKFCRIFWEGLGLSTHFFLKFIKILETLFFQTYSWDLLRFTGIFYRHWHNILALNTVIPAEKGGYGQSQAKKNTAAETKLPTQQASRGSYGQIARTSMES
jgi:hypothetical protein